MEVLHISCFCIYSFLSYHAHALYVYVLYQTGL
jgi:hypothetical protein